MNSFFWVREGKDSLALGNITGAMVFQSTIPVGIGLTFTDWDLAGNASVSLASLGSPGTMQCLDFAAVEKLAALAALGPKAHEVDRDIEHLSG